jgi:hypothetical protein
VGDINITTIIPLWYHLRYKDGLVFPKDVYSTALSMAGLGPVLPETQLGLNWYGFGKACYILCLSDIILVKRPPQILENGFNADLDSVEDT